MNELRIILLLIGLGIIAAVYAWTRYRQQPRRRPRPRRTAARRPVAEEPDAAEIEQELARMERLLAEDDGGGAAAAPEPPAAQEPPPVAAPPPAPAGPDLVVVSVVAEAGQPFSGEALFKAFQHNRLKHGEQGIYHRLVFRDNRQQPVFSVANLVKPGTFPDDAREPFTTPGVTLILQLPGVIDNLEAFDDFVKTAERLAVELGGELRDAQHQVLSHQGLMVIRESIAARRFQALTHPA